MRKEPDRPEVYVACLASYTCGISHGEWFDATKKPDMIRANIEAMLRKSPVQPAEEWALHDHKNFQGMPLEEGEPIETIHDKAIFVEDYGAAGVAVIELADDLADARQRMEEDYLGTHESIGEYVADLAEEEEWLATAPDVVSSYVDWEGVARDLQANGEFECVHQVKWHIFAPRRG